MSDSDSEDTVEELEFLSDKDVFEDNFSCSLGSKNEIFSQLLSSGTFKHRLLLANKDNNGEVKHGYDLVSDFVERKKKFIHTFQCKTKYIAKNNLSTIFSDMRRQIDTSYEDFALEVPLCVPTFMRFTKKQPDEAFFGSYNWYYTGGCLQHLYTNENNYLAYAGGESRDNLCIVPFKYDKEWRIDDSSIRSVTVCPGKEIFQVKTVESLPQSLIGVRQKNLCVVYYYSEDETITKCFNTESDVPFTSFDISSVHEELCTINTRQGFSYWNIHGKKLPVTSYFPSDNPRYDKWHNLWYTADPSVVSLAGRKSIKWMDRRTNDPQTSMKLASLKRIHEDEEISVHFASKQRPYSVYVATNMNLLMIDVRSPNSVLHRWSHYLRSPPLYNCVIPFGEENEIACIGNHYPGNVVLAYSNEVETHPFIEIPSRLDSLLSYQAAGLYLNPSIMPRMTSSLTGLTSVKCSQSLNVELLTQTASSDIFSQAFFDTSPDAKSYDLSGLVSPVDTLMASKRWNMTELYQALSDKKLKLCTNPPKRNQKQAWQASKEELMEYKDVLASIILTEWDIGRVDQKQALTSEQKVNAWLDMYSFEPPSTSDAERGSLLDG